MKKPHLAFTLRTVFLGLFLVALACTAYHQGYRRGREVGPLVPSDPSASNIYLREYDVAHLAKTAQDGELLVNSLRSCVAPESWSVKGGYAVAQFNDDRDTLLIQQVWPKHVEVVTCRRFAARNAPQQCRGLSRTRAFTRSSAPEKFVRPPRPPRCSDSSEAVSAA